MIALQSTQSKKSSQNIYIPRSLNDITLFFVTNKKKILILTKTTKSGN